jgi:hypothetical protein
MPKQVLIWPSPWNNRPKNEMFQGGGYSARASYRRAFVLWRGLAARHGFELNTWDMKPIEQADVLWFIDLPTRRQSLDEARGRAPNRPAVLQICESPVVGPHFFNPRNQKLFDYVVTYEASVSPNGHRFQYFLPLTLEPPKSNPSFASRKVLCMVNTNRVEGAMAVRQAGWTGLPTLGRLFTGWKLSPLDLSPIVRGDLYSERRKLARAADSLDGYGFDFFGKGWNGEQISWCRFYRNAPYRSFRKQFVEDKISLLSDYRFSLSFENWRGRRLYISDKLFDGFLSGSVPVYLGEEGISEFVPSECFVDARHFATYKELLLYLKSCPEGEWQEMRDAGQKFLHSKSAQKFSDESFAERMVEILKRIT